MDVITLDHRWPHRRSARDSRREGRLRTIADIVVGISSALFGGWVLLRFGPGQPFSGPLGTTFVGLTAAWFLFGIARIVRRHFR